MGRLVWWLGVPAVFGAGVFAGVLFSPPLGTALLEVAGLDGGGRKALIDYTTTGAVEPSPGRDPEPASDPSATIAHLMHGIAQTASYAYLHEHAYILSPHAIASGEDLILPQDLTRLSLTELGKRHAQADAAGRAAILEEVQRRELRVTEVSGEFFPDMVLDSPHDAFIYVSRGKKGDTVAATGPAAAMSIGATMEPVTLAPVQTETSSTIGVQLRGAGFDIEPKEMIWRQVPDGQEETFLWVVTPRKEGQLQLTIDLRQKLIFGGETIERPVRSFPKTIAVSADLFTRIGRAVGGVSVALDTANKIGVAIAAFLGIAGIGGLGTLIQYLYRRLRPPRAADV
ncbi:Uncharacterised protein [Pannonibacter phragmitetus]|uniref:Uncharacterized protein n=1 Tax=Pannonibacter phragmitetus TaxID=121719 RepID=A0A378ZWH3_9HYPH|nr:hypothetical protein [Pannonibacter phragmitetus]SUB01574.1 Uncharacterised protein [Pannonibacter phragmitetus]